MLPDEPAVVDHLTITLYEDGADRETQIAVSPKLAALLAYADAWARKADRNDNATLTFSSTLAAMVAGDHPLCGWLRLHLALRGAAADAATRGWTFPGLPLPSGRLTTTLSFRRALAQAQALTSDRTLHVRHLMAAYPVVKSYHPGDFLRLRIDRRAWCLALAEHLQRTEPAETRVWRDYARLAPEVLLPRYRPDLPTGIDLLGVGREAEAFAMLIAAPDTAMPLSIGVFGAWGSGKSYFMARVEERVASLVRSGAHGAPYLQRIAQVRFNAWHYSEGDVVASLVDQILRNLRFGPAESNVMLAQRRAAVVAQVAAREQEWQDFQSKADATAADEARLRDQWERISAEHTATVQRTAGELAAAQASVTTAQQEVDAALGEQARALDAARRAAPAEVALEVVRDRILADPTLAKLDEDLRHIAREARWLGVNWWTIALGLLVVALTVLGASMVTALRDSPLVTILIGALGTAAPFAVNAMGLLRQLSQKGAAFQSAVIARTQAEVARIEAENALQLQQRRDAVTAAQARVEQLRTQVDALATAAQQARQALATAEERRREAREMLEVAAAAAEASRRRLTALTVGSLLEDTIQEAGDTEVFRKQLGTLSHARSFFQRLSETMTAARQDFANGKGPAPQLERVVLYIDDLDRCQAENVRKVLQAVHLLLAFDLFVCVVAVDPRWIIQCLAKSPGLIDPEQLKDADLDVLGGLTTPSDYLEKIFQIPLWLRPIPPERRAALAATLLQHDVDTAGRATSGTRDANAHGGIDLGSDDEGAAPVVPVKEVRIARVELEFLQTRVSPLLAGNSRALKRFVNTYHLVKAALSEVEFAAFNEEPYRVCMALLALLATRRQRARRLAALVDNASASPPANLEAWLHALQADKDTELCAIGKELGAALLPELAGLGFDRFTFWFERTRRYSFYL